MLKGSHIKKISFLFKDLRYLTPRLSSSQQKSLNFSIFYFYSLKLGSPSLIGYRICFIKGKQITQREPNNCRHDILLRRILGIILVFSILRLRTQKVYNDHLQDMPRFCGLMAGRVTGCAWTPSSAGSQFTVLGRGLPRQTWWGPPSPTTWTMTPADSSK